MPYAFPAATPQQDQSAEDGGAPPVYGYQGVFIETLDGKTVSAQAVDQTFNPASSIKLATALIALRTFGSDHRFTTGFWTDGSFDKASGQIVGNLYVMGSYLFREIFSERRFVVASSPNTTFYRAFDIPARHSRLTLTAEPPVAATIATLPLVAMPAGAASSGP